MSRNDRIDFNRSLSFQDKLPEGTQVRVTGTTLGFYGETGFVKKHSRSPYDHLVVFRNNPEAAVPFTRSELEVVQNYDNWAMQPYTGGYKLVCFQGPTSYYNEAVRAQMPPAYTVLLLDRVDMAVSALTKHSLLTAGFIDHWEETSHGKILRALTVNGKRFAVRNCGYLHDYGKLITQGQIGPIITEKQS